MIRRLRGIPRRFRFPWRTASQIEREVDDELQFHIGMQGEALEREGVSPEDARAEALRRFGDFEGTRRRLTLSNGRNERQTRWRTMIEDWQRDVRYGARSLARTPGFTAVAVVVLGLGIGANSTVFSLIVGVVPGVLDPMREQIPSPHVYVPFGQHYATPAHLHVRTAEAIGPAAILETIRDELRAVDPALPILSLTTMLDYRETSLFMWGARTAGRMFSVLAALALVLAVVGVYGVTAFLVSRRTRDIGVRMALGATQRNVMHEMLRESLGVILAGVGIGLLLAAGVTQLLRAAFANTASPDPLVFVGSATLLAAAAMAAAYLPARRATRIYPTTALRHE